MRGDDPRKLAYALALIAASKGFQNAIYPVEMQHYDLSGEFGGQTLSMELPHDFDKIIDLIHEQRGQDFDHDPVPTYFYALANNALS